LRKKKKKAHLPKTEVRREGAKNIALFEEAQRSMAHYAVASRAGA